MVVPMKQCFYTSPTFCLFLIHVHELLRYMHKVQTPKVLVTAQIFGTSN